MLQIITFTIWVLILCFAASYFFSVPYAVSFACISVLACIGHLITFDDDLPGGWSNPEGEKSIVHWSIIELCIKILFAIIVCWVVYTFPQLSEYGA